MTVLAQEPPRARSLRIVLEVAFVGLFLLLIWNNFALRRQQARVAAAVSPARGFMVKDYVETIPTVDLNGRPGSLDLRGQRTIVAVIDPRCESCRELIASLRGARGVRVLSVAPPAVTRPLAERSGLAAVTSVVGQPLPKGNERQLQFFPQLFVVDRGKVVRTCASVGECVSQFTPRADAGSSERSRHVVPRRPWRMHRDGAIDPASARGMNWGLAPPKPLQHSQHQRRELLLHAGGRVHDLLVVELLLEDAGGHVGDAGDAEDGDLHV